MNVYRENGGLIWQSLKLYSPSNHNIQHWKPPITPLYCTYSIWPSDYFIICKLLEEWWIKLYINIQIIIYYWVLCRYIIIQASKIIYCFFISDSIIIIYSYEGGALYHFTIATANVPSTFLPFTELVGLTTRKNG